jgi:hypothetical protein
MPKGPDCHHQPDRQPGRRCRSASASAPGDRPPDSPPRRDADEVPPEWGGGLLPPLSRGSFRPGRAERTTASFTVLGQTVATGAGGRSRRRPAVRKAGELLAEMEKNPGGGDRSTGCGVQPVPSLADLGIEKTQTFRWQREAAAVATSTRGR